MWPCWMMNEIHSRIDCKHQTAGIQGSQQYYKSQGHICNTRSDGFSWLLNYRPRRWLRTPKDAVVDYVIVLHVGENIHISNFCIRTVTQLS